MAQSRMSVWGLELFWLTVVLLGLGFQPDITVGSAVMVGQRIGYIRVSTLEQSTVRRLDGVQLDRFFTDKASGKDVKRP